MATFTDNHLLTYFDLLILVNDEGYFVKNSFIGSNLLVTKDQIIDALWLDGNPPLASYSSTQLVRYGDINPLGTIWIGENWECVTTGAPVNTPPTAPTIVLTNTTEDSISISWAASPGTDDVGIVGYLFYWVRTATQPLFTHSWIDIGLVTNYTLNNLLPDEEYSIYVRAYDIEPLNGAQSNILLVDTDPVSGSGDMTDPFSLVRVCSANGVFKVSWSPATASVGIDYYTAYYRQQGSGTWIPGTDDPNSWYVDNTYYTRFLSNAVYEVKVTATDNNGVESGPTNILTIDAISISSPIAYGDPYILTRGVVQYMNTTFNAPTGGGAYNKCEWDQHPANNGNFSLTITSYTAQTITGRAGYDSNGLQFWEAFTFNVCSIIVS